MKFCKTCMELEFSCETVTGNYDPSYRCKACGRAFLCHKSDLKIAVLEEKGT